MKRVPIAIAVVFGLAFGLLCLGFSIPFELVFYLLIGWASFLVRKSFVVQVNWADVTVGLLAMVLFLFGLHWFCRWLAATRAARNDATNDKASPVNSTWPFRNSAMIVTLVVLMFVAGTAMIGLVHQFIWLMTMREPMFAGGMSQVAYRNGSLNKLRTQGLGVRNFESDRQVFPSGATTDSNGRLLHGWMTQILPYVEEKGLHEQVDLVRPWNSQVNAPVFRQQPTVFRNPFVKEYKDDADYGLGHYSANVHALGGDRRRTIVDFSDGLGETILLGEAAGNYKAWGSPTNWRDPAIGLGQSPDGFGGPWRGFITIVTFGDNSIRILSNNIDPQVLRALSTPGGGETVDMENLD